MDIWKEGKYLDLWSVNHFLSGIVYGGWMLVLGIEFWLALVTYFVLAVGWEILEVFRGIHEHGGNKVMDVVAGLIGFALLTTNLHADIYVLGLFTLIYISMELIGYRAYKKRTASNSSSNIIH